MKSRIRLLTLACAAVFLVGNSAQAQVANDYKTNGAGSTWGTASHWDIFDGSNWVTASFYPGESGGPTPVDVNILDTMAVDVTDALATTLDVDVALTINTTKLLTVNGAMDVDANITVNGTGVLEITGAGTSDIATNLTLTLSNSGSTLRIVATHTIGGAGAIVGAHDDALIVINGVTFTSTMDTVGITGALDIVDGASNGTFDNRGIVNANASGTLLLSVSTVQSSAGNTRWQATASGGKLDFSAGAYTNMLGGFQIANSSEIEVNTTALNTSGGLAMASGLLDVKADLTMGDNTTNFANITGGQVVVAAGKTFSHL